MEKSFDVIDLVVNVLITASVISVIFFLATLGQRMYLRATASATNKMKTSYSEDWQGYNRTVIKGDEVHYLVDRYSDLFIRVVTPQSPYGFFTFSDIDNPDASGFVDPSQDFLVSMIYNEHNSPVGMSIEQLSTLDTPVDSKVYCNSADRVLAAYDRIINEVDQSADNMRVSNDGRYERFNPEVEKAALQYYSDYASLRLYSVLKEAF